MPDQQVDIVVIGAGIVGLSTAMHLTRSFPRLRVLVLEKESRVAAHQSGHNSGVIHSGVYYKPGSLKARLCVEGARAMVEFCREHGIAYEVCGKIIAATSEDEIPRLKSLFDRGQANGIQGVKLLQRDALREIEPHAGGIFALHVPSTGITDYAGVCEKYADMVTAQGGTIRTGAGVVRILQRGQEQVIETTFGTFVTSNLINCAGLQSDRVSRMAGREPEVAIVPFRGEYYDLVPEKYHLVKNLIYPVPDPEFPFLGVHFTRRVHGGVDAGPNAVLALKREGYRRSDFSLRDAVGEFTYPGFWRMASQHWKHGAGEFWRSLSKQAFVRALQRLLPEISADDLVPGGSGVRAQALKPDGSLADDFQFVAAENQLHVYNVPSPAATASLPIGRTIMEMARKAFGLL